MPGARENLWWRASWATTTLLTIVAACAMLCAPFESVLRDYSIDDSFYYSEVARRFAATGISTFDGFEVTNGYHPLWMLVSSLIFFFGFDGESAIYATRVLEIVLVGAGILMMQIAMRRASMHAVAALTLVALGVRTKTLVQGLETALLFCILGAIAWAYVALRGKRRWRYLGLLTLAAGLARLECFAIAAPLAIAALRDPDSRAQDAVARLALPPCLGLALYVGINSVVLGSPVPVSGLVKQAWSQAARAASDDGSLWHHMSELWGKSAVRDGLAFGAMCAAIAFATSRSSSAGVRLRARFWTLAACIAGLHGIRVAYFAVTTWPPLSSYEHYYVTGPILRIFAIAGIADLALRLVENSPRETLRAALPALASLAVLGVSGRAAVKHYRAASADTVDWEVAVWRSTPWIAQNIDADARIASFDSGVLAFFAPQAVTNLDGLINSRAFHEAVQEQRGVDWFCARKIRYVCNASPSEQTRDYRGFDSFEVRFWDGLGLRGKAPKKLQRIYRAPERDAFLEAGRSFRVHVYRVDP